MSESDDNDGLGVRKQFQTELEKVGLAVLGYDGQLKRWRDSGVVLKGMSVRFPQLASEEYLVTLRAVSGDEHMVAFQSGVNFADVLRGLLGRLHNNSIKWSEDKYARE